jgi:CHAT domain-containing protein/tetratricopeptide (TPR) repeat protein
MMPAALGLALFLAAAPPVHHPTSPRECADLEPGRCDQSLARGGADARRAVSARLRARLGRDPQDVRARLALGLIAQDQGDPAAEALLRAAADGAGRTHDLEAEAGARGALVPVLLTQGRMEEAGEALAAAARAAAALGNGQSRTAVRVLEARLAMAQNAYGAAWALLKEVEPAVFPAGGARLQADTLAAMGSALTELGRHREARDCYARQLDLARREGDRHGEAAALYAVARATSRILADITPEVVTLMEQALQVALESGNASAEVATRLALAQAPRRALGERIEQLERALIVLRRQRDVGQTCFALRELARWIPDLPGDQSARAFRAADEAIRRAREAGDRYHLARGLSRRWYLAQIYWPRERAVAAGLEVLSANEAVRDLQGDEEARARLSSEWVFLYQQLIGFLLTPPAGPPTDDDLDRALRVSERLRARELLGALDAAGSTAVLGEGRPEHGGREAVLRQIARAQQRLLDVGLGPDERLRLLGDLERLEVRERALHDELAAHDPAFASLRSPRLATLAGVRESLAPDQALLSFVLCQRKSSRNRFERPWVFVVTRDAARAVALADAAANPERSVAGLAGLVGRRDGSEAAGAERLYRVLLADALTQLPPSVRRLVIVPDAALYRIPFDALPLGAGPSTLGERYEITMAPSATLWLRLRHQPRAPGTALLGLADPQWTGPDGVAIERQAVLWQGLSLGRLPRGRREVGAAWRSLRNAGRLVTGEEATERFLKTADLRPYAVLHLAAHAVVDDDNPARSAIVLAPGGPEEDGLLQSREIVGLDLSGLVVVLSACRSSSGVVLQGEGTLSLARAFLQAGARAVIGNLWEVRDDEAEALMSAFYRRLGEGRSVGGALAEARREQRLSGAPTAAWAGTVLLGDGEAVVVPSPVRKEQGLPWVAVTLAAAVVLASMAYRRRRDAPV